MKKIAALALCVVLSFALMACGSTKSAATPSSTPSAAGAASSAPSSSSPTDNRPAEASESPSTSGSAAPSDAPEDTSSGVLGDYSVTIKSCETAEDIDGKPAIIVTYEWTNNSDKETSFMIALSSEAIQDGKSCEPATVVADGFDAESFMQDVKPGATGTVQEAYTLIDTKNPIQINVEELLTFEENPPEVSTTFTFES